MDNRVRVYEVGPRDGLQNEPNLVPTATKARFIELLAGAGLREIEATSFVAPRAIPQLADADELLAGILGTPGRRAVGGDEPGLQAVGGDEPGRRAVGVDEPGRRAVGGDEPGLQAVGVDGPGRRTTRVRYPVLVPNMRGFARAEAAGADALAVFTAATDAFTTANIGMTVRESLEAFAPVLERAGALGWWRRGYVSTAFGCPYDGRVEPARAVDVALRLLDLGVDEVCFGDTIGVGVPAQVAALTGLAVSAGVPLERIAYHFHDTRGTALANVAAGLDAGVRCFDASAGGTGGCPYAPGAAGNLATEDLIYFLDASGWESGVSLDGVLGAARFIANALGRPLATKVGQAGGWDPASADPIGAPSE